MTTSTEMEHRLADQFARMLRVSLAAEWVCTPEQQALLRRGILSRYVDMVRLERADEARHLLAWRDAELSRLRGMHGQAA